MKLKGAFQPFKKLKCALPYFSTIFCMTGKQNRTTLLLEML
ncbi:hypothetical protein [Pseudochrobactrum sp. HB0163]